VKTISHWLAQENDSLRHTFIQRFDPAYWTINFPAPMMASLISIKGDTLQAQFNFLTAADLAGIIWTSEDTKDHPLLRYKTKRDYRGVTLSFHWKSMGSIIALDQINGPVLTLEGRDTAGVAKSWYVRLWNYATGTPTDADIKLDLDALSGGFSLPLEADPVWAGDIDRMFISVAPVGYTGTATPLGGSGVEATVFISKINADGAGVILKIGDAFVPEHNIRMSGGYDDVYDITPERMLRNISALGYRGIIDHYIGISHFPRLTWNAAAQKYLAGTGAPVNQSCIEWHADFFNRATQLGLKVQLALSFELLDAYCPENWKQRAYDGTPALTGYTPPSTLLSPVNAVAMDYLKSVLDTFFGYMLGVNGDIIFQMGEPWWWSGLGQVRKPCFYDAGVLAQYPAETGRPVPPVLTNVTASLTPAHILFLDWLGQKLSAATLALAARARVHLQSQATLLVYIPQIIEDGAPMLVRANLPIGWAYPAFDRLQLEDYEFLQAGLWHRHRTGLADARARLNYPNDKTDYLSGFADQPRNQTQWRSIVQALNEPNYAERYLWAYPQIVRDGVIIHAHENEDIMIDLVQFPLTLGYGSSGGPEFSTTVVQGQSGFEFRNQNWAQARRRYDASIGVRSEADVKTLLAFFEARQGAARGFLYRDPLDDRSRISGAPAATDQNLGVGDGVRSVFPLIKTNGTHVRRITHPVAASVRVALNGVVQNNGWSLGALGTIEFSVPPQNGVSVQAGYIFDVPVRFENDRLSGALATWAAGEVDVIPLIEIREA
jgi:uncharacterized protein (TIGR02217 family)